MKILQTDRLSLNFYGNLPNAGIISETVIDPNFAWEPDVNASTVKSILYVHLLWFSDRISQRSSYIVQLVKGFSAW
jgi:hypothetical protein